MKQNQPTRRETLSWMATATALGAMPLVTQPAEAVPKTVSKEGKILMPVGDATEVVDTLYPFFRVQEEGYQAVIAGPEARMYHMVLHEVPPAPGIPWDTVHARRSASLKGSGTILLFPMLPRLRS